MDRADQTQRLRKLAAIFWVLGLSLRGVTLVLSAFRVSLSHMTVWRDLQEQAHLLEESRRWQPVRVVGLDGAYLLGWGKKRAVLIAIDLGIGQPVAIAQVDESNPQAVRRFLEPLVQRLGVSVIVSDDLVSFRKVTDKLHFEHQVCQFHPSTSLRTGSPPLGGAHLAPTQGNGPQRMVVGTCRSQRLAGRITARR